jgi:hypothetical protein
LPDLTFIDACASSDKHSLVCDTLACHWSPELGVGVKHRPKIYINGTGFASITEAVLGLLLEELVADFQLISGVTVQVPIGSGRSVDFKIGDILIEFHGAYWLRYQSKSLQGRYRNRHQEKKNDRQQHTTFDDNNLESALSLYRAKRRAALALSPYCENFELIITTSIEEFYDKVIKRLAMPGSISFKQFRRLYLYYVEELKAL